MFSECTSSDQKRICAGVTLNRISAAGMFRYVNRLQIYSVLVLLGLISKAMAEKKNLCICTKTGYSSTAPVMSWNTIPDNVCSLFREYSNVYNQSK